MPTFTKRNPYLCPSRTEVMRQYRKPTRREGLVALGVIVIVNALGALPAVLFGTEMEWVDRPWFYPPEILFPIVWTILFTLMGFSVFLVWRHGTDRPAVRIALLTFALQFALNLSWTPVFFGLQRADLGLLVIILLWVAITATVVTFARVSRLAAALLIPYLAWVSFALVLNYAIYATAG